MGGRGRCFHSWPTCTQIMRVGPARALSPSDVRSGCWTPCSRCTGRLYNLFREARRDGFEGEQRFWADLFIGKLDRDLSLLENDAQLLQSEQPEQPEQLVAKQGPLEESEGAVSEQAPPVSESFGSLWCTKGAKQSYIEVAGAGENKALLVAISSTMAKNHAVLIDEVLQFALRPNLSKDQVRWYRDSLLPFPST